ncbi:MAG: hypothetical protein IJ736_11220, partial [Firmicutes bacterium]|nr:hypothetical protein [Bacillota bacterium]
MLNKRVLRKIPCEEADERILSYAENTEKHVEWIVTANFADKDKKILLMTFYRVEDLRKNIKKAVSRTFLSKGCPNSKELGQKMTGEGKPHIFNENMEPKNDYITQDMRVSNARWLTASFEMMTDPIRMWNWWEPISNRAYILPEHTQLVKDFFKEYAEESDKSVWRAVMRFQSGVRAERLNLKHEKETDRIDRVMSRVGEVPIEFKAWCKDKVLEFSRYLIYKDIGDGMARCRCTQCGETGEVKRREIILKHKAEGVCPFCGSKVSIAAEGRLKSFHDSCRAAFVEPFDAGFMVRIFDCHREGGSAVPTRDYMIEDLRAVYTPKNGRQEKEFEVLYYEWAEFKNTGKVRWCYDGNKIRYDGRYMLYPNNLPQAWQHTYLKYSAIEILSKNVSEPLNYGNAIKCIADFPKLEWLIKMGFTRLVKDRLHWDGQSRCDL